LTGVWIKTLGHLIGLWEPHRGHLRRVGILGGRLHPLRHDLARPEVLILHGRRGGVSEGLLLLEAELRLL
jgi:hypothetical protein